MSQSGSSTSKSCGDKATVQLPSGGSVPHKFSSIVNKVESLISKMHHDKVNTFKLLQQQGCQDATKEMVQGQEQRKRQNQEKDLEKDVDMHQKQNQNQDQEQKCKCASLDSLNNLTDGESCEEHEILYTDSDDAEIAHITGITSAQVHHQLQHQNPHQQLQRRSDLGQLTNESIRHLNEQCCVSMRLDMCGNGSGSELGMDNDNAWSVEEDIVYKCCASAPSAATATATDTLTSSSTCASVSNAAAVGLCEQCCFEDQLSYKLQYHQRDDNNNEEQDMQMQMELRLGLAGDANVDDMCLPMALALGNSSNSSNAVALCGAASQPASGVSPGTSSNSSMTGSKTRRVSNASNGSVSRMETILEEPSESKISVKEILARFETMNSNE
ncbi:Hypothetical predicted protein, partial [Drosophila guanche]